MSELFPCCSLHNFFKTNFCTSISLMIWSDFAPHISITYMRFWQIIKRFIFGLCRYCSKRMKCQNNSNFKKVVKFFHGFLEIGT